MTDEHPAGRRLTVRRARVYIIVGLCAAVACGWGSDYQSCQRSAFWVHYFNGQSAALVQDARVARRFAAANVSDPTKRALDLEQASADLRQARVLHTAPLECLRLPLPGTPHSTPY